jgi:hypothetical protein
VGNTEDDMNKLVEEKLNYCPRSQLVNVVEVQNNENNNLKIEIPVEEEPERMKRIRCL